MPFGLAMTKVYTFRDDKAKVLIALVIIYTEKVL
jgi:hypothetical protein